MEKMKLYLIYFCFAYLLNLEKLLYIKHIKNLSHHLINVNTILFEMNLSRFYSHQNKLNPIKSKRKSL